MHPKPPTDAPMTAERWQEVKRLLEECLDQTRSERSEWLQGVCCDSDVRAEVLSLLRAHETGTDYLEQPVRAGAELMAALRPDSLIGNHIGQYRLVEEIGRGGMGTVYRAVRDDHEFDIQVAIKIVSRGMDTDLLLRRFRTERQILAHLDHPYIGRMLDGGTTPGGLPYFVMEYVQGLPLTEYCDRHKLNVDERIQLFRKVCSAVAYAHANLIVHRDLKPANILVTADGTPKLLDFGIARIVNGAPGSATEPTVTMLRMATPAYASPEQIRGVVAGVPSDIYSLGVILYELLTGHRPYRLPPQTSGELARVICEREPTRASVVVGLSEKLESSSGNVTLVDPARICRDRGTTVEQLRKRLRGDLDNVLAMALRKEPHRRYESVETLSNDLHRHLAGLPVAARKDTWVYRTGKFVERHRAGVALGALVFLFICGSALFGWRKATALASRLEEDHRLASAFVVDIHDTIAKLPGSTAAREAMLAKSLQYLNGLSRDSGGDPGFLRSLALAHERFAELQIGVMGPGLARSGEALETIRKAVAVRETVVGKLPRDRAARYELAAAYLLGNYIAGRAGRVDLRSQYAKKALPIVEKLIEEEPRSPQYRSALARAHTSIAYDLLYEDKWEEGRKHLMKALSIHAEVVAENPGDLKAKRDLAQIHYRLGSTYTHAGLPAHALEHLTQALEVQRWLLAAEPTNSQYRSDAAGIHHFLGVAYRLLRQPGDALSHFDEAVSIRKAALAQDTLDSRSRSMLAGNLSERAEALLDLGETAEALASAKAAVDYQQQVLRDDPVGAPVRISMADFEARVGRVYVALAQRPGGERYWHDASEWARRAVTRYNDLASQGHLRSTLLRADAGRARQVLAEAEARSQRRARS